MKLVRNQVRDQIWGQQDLIQFQIRFPIWDQVRDQIWDQILDNIWDQIWDQINTTK